MRPTGGKVRRSLVILCVLFFSILPRTGISAESDLAWAKRVTGPDYVFSSGISVSTDGTAVVTGYFRGATATFSPGGDNETTLTSAGSNDIFVAKYNSDGSLAWAKRTGGSHSDIGSGISVGMDGTAVVIGYFQETATFGPGEANETVLISAAAYDIFIAKYNSDGSLAWARRAGGSDIGIGSGISVGTDGTAVVTGHFEGTATFGPGEANETTLTSAEGYDIFVAKYNSDGSLAWAKRAGGSNHDYSRGISIGSDGTAVVTGDFWGTATFGPGEDKETTLTSARDDWVLFVAKYNSDGSLAWVKRADGLSTTAGRAISVGTNGTALVTGNFRLTATFGLGENNETTLTSADSNDIFVAKYNSDGSLAWAKRAGGSDYDIGSGISVGTDGTAFVAGYFEGGATFGPGEDNETTLISAAAYDIFIAKYNSDGSLLWAKRAGGSDHDWNSGISVGTDGKPFVTGYFEGTATFGPDEDNETTLTSAGAFDVFVAKFGDTPDPAECTLPGDCDDLNPCTDDDCVLSLCVNTNNMNQCNDTDPCTMNDTCSGGFCVGDPLDQDSDGFVALACGGADCDDASAEVSPDIPEIPDNGIDDDCDGAVDLEDPDCASFVGRLQDGTPVWEGDIFADSSPDHISIAGSHAKLHLGHTQNHYWAIFDIVIDRNGEVINFLGATIIGAFKLTGADFPVEIESSEIDSTVSYSPDSQVSQSREALGSHYVENSILELCSTSGAEELANVYVYPGADGHNFVVYTETGGAEVEGNPLDVSDWVLADGSGQILESGNVNNGNPLPPPLVINIGACCDSVSGACTEETETECTEGGGTYQGDATECVSNPCIPTAVDLAFFEGAFLDNMVRLEWLTASEIDCAGFHLWRAEEKWGEYKQITRSLIDADGSPLQGAAYSFEDTTTVPGSGHWYKLEILDFDGSSILHGPLLVEPPPPIFCGTSVSTKGVNHSLWILLPLAAMLGFLPRRHAMWSNRPGGLRSLCPSTTSACGITQVLYGLPMLHHEVIESDTQPG